jgi:glyceraldehyde 3-phosphate dehydrogenase
MTMSAANPRVGINGFGRIGRMILRAGFQRGDVDVVAINDLLPVDHLAYLLRYDSVHGAFPGAVAVDEDRLVIDGRPIRVTQCAEPERIDWGDEGAGTVVEASGRFLTRDLAGGHRAAGAAKVLLSAPPKDDTPVFVLGVNALNYDGETIVSTASCTTNCVAPLAKVLHDSFGVEQALMLTVHAATASQNVVDGIAKSDWRFGRSVFGNIIPATTGAARMAGRVIPELSGRINGMAVRVPVADVSMLDLTCTLSREADYPEVCAVVRAASVGDQVGIIACRDEPVVSSDLRGDSNSCILDVQAGMRLDGGLMKLIAWYDNEWGYANRCLDMVRLMAAA